MEQISDGIRKRRSVAKVFKELDAFPKVPEDYQETSTSGGTVSILVFLFIGILIVSEFIYYLDTDVKYQYEVDKDSEHKMRINIDMTVAMECNDIGADVLDVAGASISTDEHLKMEPTYFKMSNNQLTWWQAFRKFRRFDEGFRSLREINQMSLIFGHVLPTYIPEIDKKEFADREPDACRIYGNVEVNKVAGNFHVTAGKSIPHPRGHAHLSSLVSELNYNFSHRIDLLSFGDPHPGLINPMDGDLQIAEKGYHMFQYYIKIVPTYIQTVREDMKANQFSVTQRSRPIDHTKGSHGVPGIFFKYDFNAVSVRIKEERRDFSQFLVRLCGIIGGVFATSGMLHSLVGFLADSIMCQIKKQRASAMKVPISQPLMNPAQQQSGGGLSQQNPQVSLLPQVQ
ncbi:endoplasmic reticulum-Golgi intermediate compartment protein 2-like [Clytia hemisphaerica]|uniref:Endoplasmic reticulum-Golgi intermediate compartment protein 2 n=1 Tax=Clytia hemisphaerica TaxID=252671 RepID=A0A7M5VEP0_9CNID|eukprot:TCONS_00004641-protein